ncbi:hypothetical protein NC651_007123 [Populus alba x Populus x berolinensis]|nr:hypothetical protein NC651_007123 [Populus alba x Populus x berolinensis]
MLKRNKLQRRAKEKGLCPNYITLVFSGVPSSRLADPAQAKAPVQARFGELDNFVGFLRCYASNSSENESSIAGS